MIKNHLKRQVLIGVISCLPLAVFSQSDNDVQQATSAYVLKGATVISSPGQVQENATLFMEDGMIQTIGSRVPIPSHAKVIECDSMFIYAGFIEGLSHTGIPSRNGDNQERPRVDDPGNPDNAVAGIVPDRSVRDVFKSDDKSIRDKREVGFTLSHVVPRGAMLPGKGSVISLNEGDVDDLLVKEDVSMYTQFRGAQRMYPSTVIAVMAKWRQMYRQAMYKKQHQEAFDSNGGGVIRPTYDRATEAMFDVVGGLPVFFNTSGSNQIYQAMRLQEDLGFNLVVSEAKQGYRVADKLKAMDKPVLVSLDLPEDKNKSKKKDDEEEEEKEMTREEMEKAELAARVQESLTEHHKQAGMLEAAGVPIAFSLVNVKANDVQANIRTMIENGLSEDAALAALTTTPASLLGVDSYTGTVEAGKMANLVVTTKPYFEEGSQVRYVFVEGEMHEYEVKKEKEKKKKDGSADDEEPSTASILGEWTYEVEIPGQTQTGMITFTGEPGSFEGEIASDDDDEVTDLDDISLEGSTLTFTMSMSDGGQSMTLEFEVELDGDSYDGDVSVGQFGTFPISGEKVPE